MQGDVALFWLVLFGFLAADNVALLPRGGDCVRFDWRGRLRYDPTRRLQFRGRDLVLLNPLNPFERLVPTDHVGGALSPSLWRQVSRRTRRSLPVLNRLSWLGSAYLAGLVALALSSAWLPLLWVLLALLTLHLATSAFAAWHLVCGRHELELTALRAAKLSLEAVFVPAYVVNMAKRVGIGQVWRFPALGLGVRQEGRMPAGPERELYAHQIRTRLSEFLEDWDIANEQRPRQSSTPSQQWAAEALKCLTTSAH